jgi:hypothetical protein
MSKGFLYSRLVCGVIVVLMTCSGLSQPSAAQDTPQLKRPNQDNSEQRPAEPKKKKVKGPRAVGLLLLSDGKATLIPVAILVEGKFYDASVYKADPVPMALEGGTVYEAEQTGESEGLFTVAGALHSQSAVSETPWMGTGSYLANGTEAAKTTRTAENVPVGLDSSGSDEPPRLTRKSGSGGSGNSSSPSTDSGSATKEPAEKSGASSPAAKGSAAGASGGDAGKGAGSSTDESGKKQSTTAEQKSSSGQSSAGQASGQASTGQPTSGAQASPAQAAPAQQSENYYRPTLRRGRPTQAAPVEEETPVKVVTTGLPGSAAGTANAKPVQVMTAISDAGGPQPESYQFFWKEGEEEERRKQMIALAEDEVRAYINARAKGAIGVKPPAASKAGVTKRKAAEKPREPEFENVQLRALDVWRTNQPVMILSAEAHFPGEPGAASAGETYSITLVSRTDIYGSLRKLYSGVTDKFHLDVTPKLELIDGVDADGDGRAELLFRETSDAGKGYVIYRPTGDKLFKMFDSLGGE